MARFNYKAKDQQGQTQKGIVEAANLTHASNLLHEQGYYIIDIREIQASVLPISFGGANISFADLVFLTRQLSIMITAGLTLVESLGILEQQMQKPSFAHLVKQLEDEVRGGKSFAEVLEKYPKVFPPIYLALIRAGEASGKLDVVLTRLADNLEKTRDFRGKVQGALIYPSIVVTAMLAVAFIVMTVVVPRLTSLYKEFGVTLPLPTLILMAASNFMVRFWWIIILFVSIFIFLFFKFKQTWLGRHVLAAISLSLPIFGSVVKESTLVEITRTLSILIDSGVPILTSLQISQDATGNVLFKEAFNAASKKVEKGLPLSIPLTENKLFPPILGQMVGVGEQTGKLGESLFKLSHYFETEADQAVHTLTTMIEPLIMILLGVGVGFLVIAVLLPIYSLTSKF